MQYPRGHQLKRDGNKWNDPKGRFEVAPKTVQSIPVHRSFSPGSVAITTGGSVGHAS
jgi:hypothetical protein